CNGLEIERPVERAIAAANDDDVFIFELVHFAYGVENGLAFIGVDAGDGWFFGHEGTATGGNHDDFGFEDLASVCREAPPSPFPSRLREGIKGRDFFEF